MHTIAYFITFTTYGSWLHGDSRTSVMKVNGRPVRLAGQPHLAQSESCHLRAEPVTLNEAMRVIVLNSIIEHCARSNWQLIAAHVRTTHVHIIVAACQSSDAVAAALKSWATRALRQAGHTLAKVWTRGASCRSLSSDSMLQDKVIYVLHGQGGMMQTHVDPAHVP